MNATPRYPVRPITKGTILSPTKVVTAPIITEESTLLYTSPSDREGTLFTDLIISGLGTVVAGVVRVFINNGSDYNVAKNSVLHSEWNISAKSASTTTVAFRDQQIYNLLLPPKYRIFINLSANTSNSISVVGNFLEY